VEENLAFGGQEKRSKKAVQLVYSGGQECRSVEKEAKVRKRFYICKFAYKRTRKSQGRKFRTILDVRALGLFTKRMQGEEAPQRNFERTSVGERGTSEATGRTFFQLPGGERELYPRTSRVRNRVMIGGRGGDPKERGS